MFEAEITTSAGFRTFIRSFNLHKQLHVQVLSKDGGFSGLRVCMMSEGKDVMCKGDFACATTLAEGVESAVFQLDVNVAQEFLKQIPPDTVLRLSSKAGGVLRMWYIYGGIESIEMPCALPVELLPYKAVKLQELKSDFVVSASVGVLRRFNKMYKRVRSGALSVLVKQVPGIGEDDIVAEFEFVNGKTRVRRVFHEGTRTQSADICAKLIDMDGATELHKSSIAQANLASFIRNMDKDTNIEISLSKENPVMLTYRLGVPNSFTRFIVATV